MNEKTSKQDIKLTSDSCKDFTVVAAIDLGTTNSGYAFAFCESYSENAQTIHLNKWQLDIASSSTAKAPTSVLFNPDWTFNSFGNKARNKYIQLCHQKKEKGWLYFRSFKMLLNDKNLTRNATITDEEGQNYSALKVFSTVIWYLKKCILHDVRIQDNDVEDSDVLYVLTVPSIWSDAAKQFMREAATEEQVGIKEEQLKLVLESEAASVYCRQIKCRTVRHPDGRATFDTLGIGNKYITVDLGGGTVDIASHEILDGCTLCEFNNTEGSNVAGQTFTFAVLEIFRDLYGKDIFSNWQIHNKVDNFELLQIIDECKQEDMFSNEGVYLKIPCSLSTSFDRTSHLSLDQAIANSKYKDQVELNLELCIKSNLFQKLLHTIVKDICTRVDNCVKESPDIDTIFIVGGLSKLVNIVQVIQQHFPNVRTITPIDADVAVLKGAVSLGIHPRIITCRLARYSYGIKVLKRFSNDKHKQEFKLIHGGEEFCENIFHTIIEKGTVLKYGDEFEETSLINAKDKETKNRTMVTSLYKSENRSPMYTTEKGCYHIGDIIQVPPEGGWPDTTKKSTIVVVEDAEIKVYAKRNDKLEFLKKLDFLAFD